MLPFFFTALKWLGPKPRVRPGGCWSWWQVEPLSQVRLERCVSESLQVSFPSW